jgi:hypothetical protein
VGFTLGSVAIQGLPPGSYILRIEDIEAGVSGTKNDKLTFKAVVAHSDNPDVPAGQKEIWSYTYAKQYISIIATDLVRAGLPKETILSGIATEDAKIFASAMRGHHYIVNVVVQKKDPTKTNTNFVQEYHAGGTPAPRATQAPAPIAAAPAAALAPMPSAPIPQPAQAAWGTPPQAAAGGPVAQAPQAAWGNPPPAAAQAPNPFAQTGMTTAPNPMPQFAPAPQVPAPAAAPFIPQANTMPTPASFVPQPAQQYQAPAPAAPQFVPAQTAPVAEAPLNPDIIRALQAGQRPPLNTTQLAQLKQVGWTAVYEEYEALARQLQGQPQAAAPVAQDPAAALMAAFATV